MSPVLGPSTWLALGWQGCRFTEHRCAGRAVILFLPPDEIQSPIFGRRGGCPGNGAGRRLCMESWGLHGALLLLLFLLL